MTIKKVTAVKAVEWLNIYGTLEAAAHEMRIQAHAIRPYTDGASEAVLRVLELVIRNADRPATIAKLRVLAGA